MLSLTGLRFLAALVVFFSHATGSRSLRGDGVSSAVQRFTGQGYVGVSFFFILSGFVMTWSHRDNDTASAFWRRRCARIAPAYWVALVAALLLTVAISGDATGSVVDALPSLPGLEAWFLSVAVYYAGNEVGWSLSAEIFFCAVFPVLVLIMPTLNSGRHLRRFTTTTANG